MAKQSTKTASPKGFNGAAKTECPLSKSEFLAAAKPVTLKAIAPNGDTVTLVLTPKVFSTGSFGWGFNGSISIPVTDEVTLKCQAGVNVIVANSKDAD